MDEYDEHYGGPTDKELAEEKKKSDEVKLLLIIATNAKAQAKMLAAAEAAQKSQEQRAYKRYEREIPTVGVSTKKRRVLIPYATDDWDWK